MKSVWGPRLVRVGVVLAVLGVLAWIYLAAPVECGGECGSRFVGLLALCMAPSALCAGLGGLLVKRGFDRDERVREAVRRQRRAE